MYIDDITINVISSINADFSAEPTTVLSGQQVSFIDQSTGNPTSWQWDFDNDGTIDSEEQNPTWIYDEAGSYTITLCVSDGTNDDTETKENYILVELSLDTGLVAYYPFNGNADDESGNGFDGTVHGAAKTTDRFENPKSAYSFDGINDYISTTVTDSNPMTVSVWVKTSIKNYLWNAIVSSHKYHQDNGHFTLSNGASSSGKASVTSVSSNGLDMTGTISLKDSVWHHLVLTSNGPSNRLYVDGYLEDTHQGTIVGGNRLYVGTGEIDNPTRLNFEGTIDDIRIYDRVLAESEIQALYTEGSNAPPVLTPIGDKAIDESGTLNVLVVATDPDGDTLSLSVSGLPSFGAFIDNGDGTGTIIFNPGPGDSGTYVMTVTASDGTSSDSESFILEVTNTNQPPEITPIDDKEVNETETLSVGVTAGDPDGDAVTLSVSDFPSFGTFTDNGDGTGTIVLNPILDTSGYYVLTVTASDGTHSASDSFTPKVNNTNQPPELAPINDQEMDESHTLTVLASATDPDFDTVTLSVSDLPSFGTFTDNGDGTGTIVFNPDNSDAGVYPMTITAGDANSSVPHSFILTVNDSSPAPYSANFSVGTIKIAVGKEVNFTDESEGNPSSWQWDFDNNGIFDSTEQNPSFVYYKPGTYSVRLVVSYGVSTYEQLKEGCIQVITPLPDLQITHFEHSQAVSGETIEVSWTVNTGPGATNYPVWYDRIWISPDLDVRKAQPEDRLLGTFENLTYLASGESYIQTRQIRLPGGLMGTYYLFVVTDNYDIYSINPNTMEASTHKGAGVNVVAELNNRNNFAFKTFDFTIPPSPDLQVTSITTPDNALSDQKINISWAVANLGEVSTGDKQWSDRVYISLDSEFNGNAISIGTVLHAENLTADSSYSVSSTFTMPHAIYGDYYIFITTDSSNNVKEYLFENNNTSCSEDTVEVILTPPPDLAATEVIIPGTASCGESINVQWTVENQGPGVTFETNWYDGIYFSNNENFHEQDAILLKSVSINDQLEPGGSYTSETSVVIPKNTAGNYYIFVKTDYRNHVFEHEYETNNTLRSDSGVTVFAPDLEPVEMSISDVKSSGQPILISYTVENQGTGELINRAWVDKVYLSEKSVFDPDSALELGRFSHSGTLAPNSTYSVEDTVDLPNNISGDHYVYIVVDGGNSIFEDIYETNNILRSDSSVTVVTPDLEPVKMSISDVGSSGQPIFISYTVENQGTGELINRAWVDKVYLSEKSVFDPDSALELGRFSHSGTLAPNSTYSVEDTVDLPNGISGDHYVYIVVDGGNSIFEDIGEDNNIIRCAATVDIDLSPWPDLEVTMVNVPDSIPAGGNLEVSWEVSNDGEAGTKIGGWIDKIYLSSAPVWNGDFILKETISQSMPLDASQSYTKTYSLRIPADLPPGDYYIYVETDADNKIYEYSDENNNLTQSNALTILPYPSVDIVVHGGCAAVNRGADYVQHLVPSLRA